MRTSINLLQETQVLQARLRRFGIVLQTISLVVLGGVALIVFLLLSYTLILKRQQSVLQARIEEKKETIRDLRPVEAKYVLVRQKLSLTDKIFTEEALPAELLVDLYDLGRDQATIKQVAARKGSSEIGVLGGSGNIFSLISYFDLLTDFARERELGGVIVRTLTREEKGEYQFDLAVDGGGR